MRLAVESPPPVAARGRAAVGRGPRRRGRAAALAAPRLSRNLLRVSSLPHATREQRWSDP